MQVDQARRPIEVLTPQGAFQGIISAVPFNDPGDWLLLRLEFAGEVVEQRTSSCWEGLRRIREQLEPRSITLVCYGASENVHASGMSASMGIGDRAYKLALGAPARTTDLIGIFDTGPDVYPVSIAQQEAYYSRWLASLRNV